MRPALNGRRAARDLARLYGPPCAEYGDAPIAANDRGVSKAAHQHDLNTNTTIGRLPRNWRGRLPMPMAWYGTNVAEMVVVNGIGTAPCPMHQDRGRSLIVNLCSSRGIWNCPVCGQGDMVSFAMRRYANSFVDAVRLLVLGGAA